MMIYLKAREYYEDLYDKFTVEHCRDFSDQHLEITDKEIDDSDLTPEQAKAMKEIRNTWIDLVKEMSVFFMAAERFNKKDAFIEERMREDQTKDHMMSHAEPPANAHCRKCMGRDLRTISKDLWHVDNGKDERVLFMFSCNKCGTNTAFFDDGEEWIVEPTRCPVCNSENLSFTKDYKNSVLTLNYTCSRCDNVWEEVHDFNVAPKEPEKPDPNYHEDRKLYCYSKKVRSWAEDMKNRPATNTRLSWQENETEKLYKAELEKVEMLTAVQIDKRLAKLLNKHGYKDFQLGKPDMDKDIQVIFTAIDSKEGRSDDESKNTVWKLINKDLEQTNWRLVRTSLNYRVGYIKGKLRAYEYKPDLEKLIDQKLKKANKS